MLATSFSLDAAYCGWQGADGDWEYSIRVNFTHADTTTTIAWPVFNKQPWSYTYYAEIYAIDGFMSIQLLVSPAPHLSVSSSY